MADALHFIFINGKGSSGKDTQAELLISAFGDKSKRISTGEIFWGAMKGSGEFARYHERLTSYSDQVRRGGYIPDPVIVEIVREVITGYILEGKRIFIFTGFPRTEQQLVETDKMLRELEGMYPVSVNYLHYEVSDEISKRRAEGRRLAADMKGFIPRPDDLEATVERRLEAFRTLTTPMLRRLEIEGRLITIDASPTVGKIAKETRLRLRGAERL